MSSPEKRCVKLDLIKLDSGTQTRCQINDSTVGEYAERMIEGDQFPPIEVFFDGTEYHAADGFHRTLAAIRNGFKDILANVHKGTATDAIWFAIGANKTNAINRTPGDKRKAVEIALTKFPEKSQQEIAKQVGCTHAWVSKIKADVVTVTTSPAARKDSLGRVQPTSKPRKMPATPPPSSSAPVDPEPTTAAVKPAPVFDPTVLIEAKRKFLRLPAKLRAPFIAWCQQQPGKYSKPVADDAGRAAL